MPYWPWNKKKMLTSSNIEEDTGKSQGRPRVCPFVWWGFSHLEITPTHPGSNTATGLLLRYIRASCAQKIWVFFSFKNLFKDINSCWGLPFLYVVCWYLLSLHVSCSDCCLNSYKIESNCPQFGNYKLISDFKSVAFICTNKEAECDDSLTSLFFLSFSSLFGQILGEAETEPPLCVPIWPSNRLWNRVLRYTKTHIYSTGRI